MVNGPLLKNMIIFAIPVMLASLISIAFNALDLVFAGQFCGTEGLTAVGSTTALTSLLTSLFLGLGVGVNVAMAHALGSKNSEAVSRVVHTAIPLALPGGFLLLVAGLFFSKSILVAKDTDPEVLDSAALYMKVYFVGCIPMLVYNFSAGIFRADGDSETYNYRRAYKSLLKTFLYSCVKDGRYGHRNLYGYNPPCFSGAFCKNSYEKDRCLQI